MKNILFILILSSLISCNNNTTTIADSDVATVKNPPILEVTVATYNFGVIRSGDVVTHEFKFKNQGKSPLVILNAIAACGCTVVDFPNKPVLPQETGVVKAVFNSSGKTGKQNKVITLTTNGNPAVTLLTLFGEVKTKLNQ